MTIHGARKQMPSLFSQRQVSVKEVQRMNVFFSHTEIRAKKKSHKTQAIRGGDKLAVYKLSKLAPSAQLQGEPNLTPQNPAKERDSKQDTHNLTGRYDDLF